MTPTNDRFDLDAAFRSLSHVKRKKGKREESLQQIQSFASQSEMESKRNRFARRVIDVSIASFILFAVGTFIFYYVDFSSTSPANPEIPTYMELFVNEEYNISTVKATGWQELDLGMDELNFLLEGENVVITISTFMGSVTTSTDNGEEVANKLQNSYEESSTYEEFVELSKVAYIENNSSFGMDPIITLQEIDIQSDLPIFKVEGAPFFRLIAFTVQQEQPFLIMLNWNSSDSSLEEAQEYGYVEIFEETLKQTKPYQTILTPDNRSDADEYPTSD